MKMTPDTGPQILPYAFGPSVKPNTNNDPQINGGPNSGFTPTVFGTAKRVVYDNRFFPPATGLPGEPSMMVVDTYQGGNPGRRNPYGVRSGWTFGI